MALEPAEQRWIEDSLGQLFVASRELSKSLALAEQKLEQAEGRNRLLWGMIATLGLALAAGIVSHSRWGGSVDTTLQTHSKQIDDGRLATERVSKDLQEHERRSSMPKPEPAK
jgi:hypothetical protein